MFKAVFTPIAYRDGGNVVLTFALLFPVLLGAAGLALDSASFYNQQSRMQSVADSSALAVAKELHLYRKNMDELKAVGEARIETLLAEVGLADNPHTIGIDVNDKENSIDVTRRDVKSVLAGGDLGREPHRCILTGDGLRAIEALHSCAARKQERHDQGRRQRGAYRTTMRRSVEFQRPGRCQCRK